VRRIAHISDLHFGRHVERLAGALLGDLARLDLDLIAISGDLTQRARSAEFARAQRFIAELPVRAIIVPGNHDVPLYHMANRAFRPLHRYRKYITTERQPFYADDEIAVLGIDTARSLTISGGRISELQIAEISAIFSHVPPNCFKILVTHHPMMPPPGAPDRPIVGRAGAALRAIEAAGVDLLLAGHYHESFTADIRSHHLTIKRSILVVQAGTAISTRLREAENNYNLLEIDPPFLTCTIRSWTGEEFAATSSETYERTDGHWVPASRPAPAGSAKVPSR
jgi:3',5'-cyclic AMP phosphodiesterase CpdA